jgi:hypothetical protein
MLKDPLLKTTDRNFRANAEIQRLIQYRMQYKADKCPGYYSRLVRQESFYTVDKTYIPE